MQVYLVGGAVRDKLLNYPVVERDWVVVGATADDLLKQGYQQVGKDFPVFLHPETKEEYALARTERKQGQGYHGFEIHADPSVTLEEDLVRRDLTINAIAMDSDRNIIDPYNGKADLKAKILRHVSPAFIEDPLRVLRVARFAARYAHLGFTIAEETLTLMSEIAKSGELKTLSAERVWQETVRALGEKNPQIYFETLKQTDALQDWFAEVDCLWGIPNPPQWHPEIDSGIHTMMVLEQATLLSDSVVTRFAALCHDLGKGITPKKELPSHIGHEKKGLPLVKKLCQRLKTPSEFTQLAKIACEYHLHLHKLDELRPQTIVKLFEKTDAFRKPERFKQFLDICEADARGRTGFETRDYPQKEKVLNLLNACQEINAQKFVQAGFSGKQIGEKIHAERVKRIKSLQ